MEERLRNILKKIDKIYELYGYEKIEESGIYKVYRFKQGMYYAVDIILFDSFENLEEKRNEYAKIGYATEIIIYKSIQDIESRMFNGFFEVSVTSSKLSSKYYNYKKRQEDNLGDVYNYVPCQYKIVQGEVDVESQRYEDKNDRGIVQKITSALAGDGAHLLLIEAAAGFGKTSTVYEVLITLLNGEDKINPIFIELSKNRQAKIFKHVLLNEFEAAYPYLKYDLIVHEIQAGKIPLIIDGFDELLYNTTTSSGDLSGDYEDVQTMLETIGEVVRGKAKVLLTTRRTAIFAGDEFFCWAADNSKNFVTTRYLLEKPTISTWIGDERHKKLNENGIPIAHISNPVLLSFIKNLDSHTFDEFCLNREKLVKGYFEKLLFREQERQSLIIDIDLQMEIFSNLAKNFLEYNISGEEKEFVRDLICLESESILKESLQRYLPNERPAIEDLAETLTNHALLDRRGSFDDQIGFINDFVFGYMLALAVCKNNKAWIQNNLIHEGYVELISNSFKVRNKIHRNCIRKKIELVEEIMDSQTILMADLNLLGKAVHKFENKVFGSLEITDGYFSEESKFKNCNFNDCVFNDCNFNISSFDDVTFLNCFFRDCNVSGDQFLLDGTRWVLACEDYGNGFIEKFTKIRTLSLDDDLTIDYERKVLEQFWLPGKEKYTPRRKMRTLYKGFEISKRSPITEAIQCLVQKNWITIENDGAIINKNHISDIMERLGRVHD